MKARTFLTSLLLVGFLFSMSSSGSQAFYLPPAAPDAPVPLGDSFSYQGYLSYNGQPATGAYDFKFSLWEDSGGLNQIGSDITANDQPVANGYFTVLLDFGAGRFQGDKRWLKIEVRPGADTGAYTPITPLHELTPIPYALFSRAAPWSGLTGVPAGFADGVDNNTLYNPGPGILRSGSDPNYTFEVDTVYVQRRVNGICPTGQAIREISPTGSVTCQDTEYTAGTGLLLAARQFSADTAYLQRRVNGNCPSGSSIATIALDGTVTCEPDDNTTYTAGWGLNLAGNAFSANSSQVQERVSGICAPGSSIATIASDGSVTCETDDDTTYTAGWGLSLIGGAFSANSSQVQPRVTGVCRPGSSIQEVRSDGTVVCWDDAPLNRPVPPGNYSWFTPLSPATVGNVNQVTTGADGLPLILFSDTSDNFYKVVHCNDPTCAMATTTNIDTFVAGGDFASMALDPEGRLQISYYKQATGDLWFARCADIACTSVVTRALAAVANDAGSYNDITIAHDGYALVVYYDATAQSLNMLHCSDRDCSAVTTVVVDPGPLIIPPDPSMTLGADGLGLVAYLYFTPVGGSPDLKVAHCQDIACTISIQTQLITGWPDGFQPSITTGTDALGLIVYWDIDYHQLRTVHCSDDLCSAMTGPNTIHTLNAANMNPQPMVTIGAAGLGVISFFDYIGGGAGAPTHVVAHCHDLLCPTVTEATWLASLSPTAITISPTGNPLLISPDTFVGSQLQVILCRDPFCAQYFRRR